MRPINKGASPYDKIAKYEEAEPYLNERIGRYCSFCELPIFHVPEVEHKEGKKSGGDTTKWENLLYGCKYCNTRKAQKIKRLRMHLLIHFLELQVNVLTRMGMRLEEKTEKYKRVG